VGELVARAYQIVDSARGHTAFDRAFDQRATDCLAFIRREVDPAAPLAVSFQLEIQLGEKLDCACGVVRDAGNPGVAGILQQFGQRAGLFAVQREIS